MLSTMFTYIPVPRCPLPSFPPPSLPFLHHLRQATQECSCSRETELRLSNDTDSIIILIIDYLWLNGAPSLSHLSLSLSLSRLLSLSLSLLSLSLSLSLPPLLSPYVRGFGKYNSTIRESDGRSALQGISASNASVYRPALQPAW